MDCYDKNEDTNVSMQLTGSSSNTRGRRFIGAVRILSDTARQTNPDLHLTTVSGKHSALASLNKKVTKNAAKATDTSDAGAEKICDHHITQAQTATESPSLPVSKPCVRAELEITAQQERVIINGAANTENVEGRPNILGMQTETTQEIPELADIAAETMEELWIPAKAMREIVQERLKTEISRHQMESSSSSISRGMKENRGRIVNNVHVSCSPFSEEEVGNKTGQQKPAPKTTGSITTNPDLSPYTENVGKATTPYAGEMGSSDKQSTTNRRRGRIRGEVEKLASIARKTRALFHLRALPEKLSAVAPFKRTLKKHDAAKATGTSHAAAEKINDYHNAEEQTADASSSPSASEACIKTALEITAQQDRVIINGAANTENVEGRPNILGMQTETTQEIPELADIATETMEELWTPAKAMREILQKRLKTEISMHQMESSSSISRGMKENRGRIVNNVHVSCSPFSEEEVGNKTGQQKPAPKTTGSITTNPDLSPYTENFGNATATHADETGSIDKRSTSNSRRGRIRVKVKKLGNNAGKTNAVRHLNALAEKLSAFASLKKKFTKHGAASATDRALAAAEKISDCQNSQAQTADPPSSSSVSGASVMTQPVITGQQKGVNTSGSVDLETVKGRPSRPGMPRKSAEERTELADVVEDKIEEPSTPAETMRETVQERQNVEGSMNRREGSNNSSNSEGMLDNQGRSLNDVGGSSNVLCDVAAGNPISQQNPALHTMTDFTNDLSLYREYRESSSSTWWRDRQQ